MKVLLTGCFGNIGEKVIETLLSKGHEVRCLDLDNKNNRKVSKRFQNKTEIHWGDITDAELVNKAVSGVDAVIHNAAIIPPLSLQLPELAQKVNVGGTQNIVNAILADGNDAQLVFPSSITVHGNNMPDTPYPKKIDTPYLAADNYAGHKIDCERLIEKSGIRFTIVRIGASIDADSKLGTTDTKATMTLMLNTHPDCRIEFIHPKDVAQAMVNAVANEEAIGNKYFLGGGKNCQSTWVDFNALIFEAIGLGKPDRNLYKQDPFYTDWMDTEESQRVLQFQKHTLQDLENEYKKKFWWLRILAFPIRPLITKMIFNQAAKAAS